MADEKNPGWKGDNVKYTALHQWIYKKLGQPSYCEHCKSTIEIMYHWANISGRYKRDVKDWMRLCVRCHKRHDINKKKGKIIPRSIHTFPFFALARLSLHFHLSNIGKKYKPCNNPKTT